MNTSQFESIVKKHSLMPDNLLYNSTSYVGELSELFYELSKVCNTIKKIEMAKERPDWVERNEDDKKLPKVEEFIDKAKLELSDSLFYLTLIAKNLGTDLYELFEMQRNKLGEQSDFYKVNFLK